MPISTQKLRISSSYIRKFKRKNKDGTVKRCDGTPNRSRAAGHDVLSQRLTGCREIMKSLCKVNSTVTVG